jgi:hypothetical protein
VSAAEVDEYLRAVEEPKRSTLQTLRRNFPVDRPLPKALVRELIAARLAEIGLHASD